MDYEDERRFSWADLFIKIIIVLIIILFIIWLISLAHMKTLSSNKVVNGSAFSENINAMKEAGINYFTTDRLPKNVGEIKTITLDRMYKNKMLLTLTDKNGKSCSAKDSYVSVEKMNDEYQMKVYLKCGKESDYVITTIGEYNYCDASICEKKSDSDSLTQYQYSKTSNGSWEAWSAFTNWLTTSVNRDEYTDVETKVVKENKGTTKYEFMGYPTCQEESGYSLILQEDGECRYKETNPVLRAPVCPEVSGYTLVSRNGFVCNYNAVNTSASTTKPALCESGYYVAQGGCVSSKTYIRIKSIGCADGQTLDNGACYLATKETVDVTYYRYRTRKYIAGTTDYKWSYSNNDQELINDGYKLTGNTRNSNTAK